MSVTSEYVYGEQSSHKKSLMLYLRAFTGTLRACPLVQQAFRAVEM